MTIEVDAGGTIVEFPDGTPHEVMQNALRAHFSPQPQFGPPTPPADRMQSLATDFLNQGSAAGQGTTPNIAAHMPQLLSTDLHQNDAGEILYRDPSTGQLVPTDQNKHVVLRDPSDNRLKMFARAEGTDEGTLSSAGRLLMTGMASGAPSRIPGGAGMAMKPQARGPAPTIDALKEAASAGYQSPEIAGLEFKAGPIQDFAQKLKATLTEAGLDENTAGTTWRTISNLEKAPPEAFVTGKNLESLRRTLANAPPNESAATRIAQQALEEFRGNPPANAVRAGDPEVAASIYQDARGNWKAAKQAEDVSRRTIKAENRASVTNSGMNVGNLARQKIEGIASDPELMRQYSPAAQAQIQKIVDGSRLMNTARFTGNVLGGGGGWPMVATGIPSGGMAPAIGFGLKLLEGTLAMREVNKLSEIIRAGSPLAQKMVNPMRDFGKAAQTFGANPTPRAFAQVSLAARNLANNLKDAGIAATPADLMRSLQGPMRAPAENEQP